MKNYNIASNEMCIKHTDNDIYPSIPVYEQNSTFTEYKTI